MGRRNVLVEGVSCTGKSTVCDELRRRGLHAINGDLELAYQGDPATGAPTNTRAHENHIWRIDAVKAIVADRSHELTFFCGGSRNFPAFIDLFDAVLVLDIDEGTLLQRLDERRDDEWGARPDERELVIRLHRTREDTPRGILVDATQPVPQVVDEVVRLALSPSGRDS